MDFLLDIFEFFRPGIPLMAALVFGVLTLLGLRLFLDKRFEGKADKNMKLQLIMLLLSFVLLVVVIVVSPIGDSQKGQILSLIGIVMSAAIALSSTTFVGNAMAGLMLRSIKNFRVGDFVSVGDSFGRVSERGLFHVEIQTDQRDLITLPNLSLVTNSVKVVRYSGTIVSVDVSLGYDVPRDKIKATLLKAAKECGLHDPFVQIVELGDFSVVYRAAGLLTDVKQLLSARSRIRECALDKLHSAGIEIVSPTFMNTRQLSSGDRFVPKVTSKSASPKSESAPEEIVFDKADEAESMEQLRENIDAMDKEISDLTKSQAEIESEGEKTKLQKKIEKLRKSRDVVSEKLESHLQDHDRDER